jgi:Icc protein
MPLTVPPIPRRQFLVGTVGTGIGILLHPLAMGQPASSVDPHRVVLISDLHIDADVKHVERGTNMADNLTRTVSAIVALDPKPTCVLINGDLAHWVGNPADYEVAVEILKPIREANIPIHVTMGNHDRRAVLWKVVPDADDPKKQVIDRQSTCIEMPRVDWYILDTLLETNGVPGIVGDMQLAWLKKSLDKRPDKPAIVMTHHQPDLRPEPKGLIDTKALTDAISPRKQVKALIYGHTHRWVYAKQEDGMHWVNLPPTAYVFAKEFPSGWVDMSIADNGATMQLHCLDEKHPQHLQKLSLDWR